MKYVYDMTKRWDPAAKEKQRYAANELAEQISNHSQYPYSIVVKIGTVKIIINGFMSD